VRALKRFALYTFGVGLFSSFAGCVGSLANPSDFVDAGTTQKTADAVLAESCGTTGCHDASSQAQAGLDLVSPNVASRVVDVNAIGLGCGSDILVVAGDPDSSYLLDKVLDELGICGLPMPVVGSISASDVEVLRQWIIDLGGSGGGTPDGG